MPTYAGLHEFVTLELYPGEIRNAIRRIADHLYVTRGFDRETVGKSHYYAVLARPTDELSVILNTDKELLFVFSNYNTFEVRALEAYDVFYKLVDPKRVDDTIRFLISADPNVETSIRHFLF